MIRQEIAGLESRLFLTPANQEYNDVQRERKDILNNYKDKTL